MTEKFMAYFPIAILLAFFVLIVIASLTDGLTNSTNTFKYVMTYEMGEYHLHSVEKWSDSTSDALGFSTSCCGNRMWTSYNVAVLYMNYPSHLEREFIVCGG